jgi:hypothetical protein
MTNEKLQNIIETQKDLKNLPNVDLIENLDLLSSDFEETKEKIINLTYYLDKLEELYNNTLQEYQNRVK